MGNGMSILIDSSVLIGYYHSKDHFHEKAGRIMERIDDGEYGEAVVTDYIFDESVTVVDARARNKRLAVGLGDHLKSSAIKLVNVSEEIFGAAWEKFKRSENLSFTDCTSLAVCEARGIQFVATFDKAFRKREEIRVVDE